MTAVLNLPSSSGVAADPFAWSVGNDNNDSAEQKERFVNPLNLHVHPAAPLGQSYELFDATILPPSLQSQGNEATTYTDSQYNTADFPKKATEQRPVAPREKSDESGIEKKTIFECDYPNCSKNFMRNEHLKRHKQTFHGEGPNRFSCEFCGKDQFNRQDNLNSHRKLHARPNSRNRGIEFIAAAVGAKPSQASASQA